MSLVRTNTAAPGIVSLVFEREDKPMNVIDAAFLEALEEKFQDALRTPGLKGVILTSSKPEFIAGADLSMFEKFKTFDEVKAFCMRLNTLFRQIEKAPVPVVAAMPGTALGGGYELALACHYRVSVRGAKAQFGLPEVLLGLMPGAGGTQRLPRVLGFQKAIPLLTQGTKLKPEAAKEQGLIDLLVDSEKELIEKSIAWISENPAKIQPWDDKKFKIPGGDVHTPKGYPFFAAANAMALDKTQGNYPAPIAILRAVYEGLQLPIDSALELEASAFARLALSKEAKQMIRTLFFHVNACNKGAARPPGVPKTALKKIGVLGAGMMGAGIAHVSAQSGFEVVLKDVRSEAAEKGKRHAEDLLNKDLAKGRITEAKKSEVLSRIHPTTEPSAVRDCDMVIEAVIEDRAIKATVTKETESVTDPGSIFASNTSTLPITGLAEISRRPQNFIGIHFFSPVEKMQLVEIIRGKQTGEKAIAASIDYVQGLKKTPIVVNDGRGFYTSRVFTKYIEEGVLCLCDGVPPTVIEYAGKAAGMPVGPLCVADEVALDLVYHILAQTKKDLGPQSVNSEMDRVFTSFVEVWKRLGRKSGGGFYEYPKDGKKYLWPDLARHFKIDPKLGDIEEVKTRLMYTQVLETLRCWDEGVLTSARDADVGSILGWGFPAFTGGTISYVDYVGIDRFISETKRLEKAYGPRFKAPKNLVEKAEKHQAFYA